MVNRVTNGFTTGCQMYSMYGPMFSTMEATLCTALGLNMTKFTITGISVSRSGSRPLNKTNKCLYMRWSYKSLEVPYIGRLLVNTNVDVIIGLPEWTCWHSFVGWVCAVLLRSGPGSFASQSDGWAARTQWPSDRLASYILESQPCNLWRRDYWLSENAD
jgi:hypothetical protein